MCFVKLTKSLYIYTLSLSSHTSRGLSTAGHRSRQMFTVPPATKELNMNAL